VRASQRMAHSSIPAARGDLFRQDIEK